MLKIDAKKAAFYKHKVFVENLINCFCYFNLSEK